MSNRTGTESTKPRPSSAVAPIALAFAAAAAITLAPGGAHAQGAPPPGGYYAPPGGGYYAPPGAYPPGGYAPPPGPRVIKDWEEGEPIPPGYHPATKPRLGLVIGGSVLFGVTWLLSALSGALISDVAGIHGRSAKLLIIPVAGPFTLLPSGSTTGDLFLVLDGLAQAGGIAMLIAGIAAPKTVLVRNDVSKVQIMPMPMTFGANSAGLGVVGKF